MVKRLTAASAIVLFLAAFSPVAAQKSKQSSASASKTDFKFLDDIDAGITESAPIQDTKKSAAKPARFEPAAPSKKVLTSSIPAVEHASSLQLKYSILLDTEVEAVENTPLIQEIEEWYGTRYVLGGNNKSGIDCSAFMQVMYASVLGITLPRTAREQYAVTRPIDDEELREGDLVFFNTRGGVSHVGMYLQNNKFVHAATSGGVMISDLDDAYWAKRYIGSGRYQKPEDAMMLTSNP